MSKKHKYHFFIIVNNKEIFENNTKLAIDNLKYNSNIEINVTENFHNKVSSIRGWINEILSNLYENCESYRGSRIVFLHQDVIFNSSFCDQVDFMLDKVDCGVYKIFGFAGIDKKGLPHKFMNDSGDFNFTNDYIPTEVETVDEFIFGIDSDVLIENKILLSKISGWHSYAAEFSIFLRKMGYKTIQLPIYLEHNSIRKNNIGLRRTHLELYKIYQTNIKTLVGEISKKSLTEIIKGFIYSSYANYVKFSLKGTFFDQIKSFLLDDLNLCYNPYRVVQRHIKGLSEVYIIAIPDSESILQDTMDINIGESIIHFRVISSVSELQKYEKNNIICFGHLGPIPNYKYLKKSNVNMKFIS